MYIETRGLSLDIWHRRTTKIENKEGGKIEDKGKVNTNRTWKHERQNKKRSTGNWLFMILVSQNSYNLATLSNDISHGDMITCEHTAYACTLTCQHYDIRYDDMWLTWCEQVCHYFFCWRRSSNKMWALEDLKLTTPCHQVKLVIFILSLIKWSSSFIDACWLGTFPLDTSPQPSQFPSSL